MSKGGHSGCPSTYSPRCWPACKAGVAPDGRPRLPRHWLPRIRALSGSRSMPGDSPGLGCTGASAVRVPPEGRVSTCNRWSRSTVAIRPRRAGTGFSRVRVRAQRRIGLAILRRAGCFRAVWRGRPRRIQVPRDLGKFARGPFEAAARPGTRIGRGLRPQGWASGPGQASGARRRRRSRPTAAFGSGTVLRLCPEFRSGLRGPEA